MHQVPVWIPLLICLEKAFLFIAPITVKPEAKYVFALCCLFVGFLIYWAFVYRKVQPKFMGKCI